MLAAKTPIRVRCQLKGPAHPHASFKLQHCNTDDPAMQFGIRVTGKDQCGEGFDMWLSRRNKDLMGIYRINAWVDEVKDDKIEEIV